MLLTITFGVLYVHDVNRVASLVIYAIAAITDFLDGFIARKTHTVSWVGKVLDPICDRMLLFTGVLALVIHGDVPIWVAIFLIARDVYLTLGSIVLQRYRRRPLDVIYMGKAATAFLLIGFVGLLLGSPVIDGLGVVEATWLPVLNDLSGPIWLLVIYFACMLSFCAALIYTAQAVQIGLAAIDQNKR